MASILFELWNFGFCAVVSFLYLQFRLVSDMADEDHFTFTSCGDDDVDAAMIVVCLGTGEDHD